MNGNAELLNFVYQNSQMGVETIQQLIGITEDRDFRRHLESQLQEYSEINRTAEEMLGDSGYDEKGIGAFEKLRTYLMINMQTLTDKSSGHIAEMMMVGSNMGIINAVKNMKKYDDAKPEALELMGRLLKIEEDNVQQLKGFLS